MNVMPGEHMNHGLAQPAIDGHACLHSLSILPIYNEMLNLLLFSFPDLDAWVSWLWIRLFEHQLSEEGYLSLQPYFSYRQTDGWRS